MTAVDGERSRDRRDDGVGFVPGEQAATHGFGLFSVRERLRGRRRQHEVESAPGEGTEVGSRPRASLG